MTNYIDYCTTADWEEERIGKAILDWPEDTAHGPPFCSACRAAHALGLASIRRSNSVHQSDMRALLIASPRCHGVMKAYDFGQSIEISALEQHAKNQHAKNQDASS